MEEVKAALEVIINSYQKEVDELNKKYGEIVSEEDAKLLKNLGDFTAKIELSKEMLEADFMNAYNKLGLVKEAFEKYDKLYSEHPGSVRVIMPDEFAKDGKGFEVHVGVNNKGEPVDTQFDFQQKVESKVKGFYSSSLNTAMQQYFVDNIEEMDDNAIWSEFIDKHQDRFFPSLMFTEKREMIMLDQEAGEADYKRLFKEKEVFKVDKIIDDIIEVYRDNRGEVVEAHPNLKTVSLMTMPLHYIRSDLNKELDAAKNKKDIVEATQSFKKRIDEFLSKYHKLGELLNT